MDVEPSFRVALDASLKPVSVGRYERYVSDYNLKGRLFRLLDVHTMNECHQTLVLLDSQETHKFVVKI